jgi:hypothetical protein
LDRGRGIVCVIYPPRGGPHYPTAKEAFTKAIERSQILLFSREVRQCYVFRERQLTDEETLREKIATVKIEGLKGGEK